MDAGFFDRCSGYSNGRCDRNRGFANDDIFPLEACLFSQVCANRDELFRLNAGEPFVCDIDIPGFRHLEQMLLEGPSI